MKIIPLGDGSIVSLKATSHKLRAVTIKKKVFNRYRVTARCLYAQKLKALEMINDLNPTTSEKVIKVVVITVENKDLTKPRAVKEIFAEEAVW